MSDMPKQIGDILAELQSPEGNIRQEAVEALGGRNESQAVAGLVLALEDPDLGIRELAANHLTRIGGDTASRLLVRFLANDDIGTRNLASEILVKIGPEAVPALIEHIESDDHDVRKFICDILGMIRDNRAVEPLRQRLWDDSGNVVCSAAEALGEIGAVSSVPDLMAVSDRTEDAQLSAIEALGKIGEASALEHLYGYLGREDAMMLCVVIEAIGKIGAADSVSRLAGFLKLEDAASRTVAEAALTAIIGINQHNVRRIDLDLPLDTFSEFLLDGVKNGNKAITEFVLSRPLSWFTDRIIEGLLDVIEYVDEAGLKRTTEVLAEIGLPAARPILDKMAAANSSLQIKLLDVLKTFVDENVAPSIAALADSDDPEVRQRVAHVLGVSGCRQVIGTLKRLAGDVNGHVRAAAYSALGWLCSDDDVEFITAGLADRYADVREAAVGALIIIGGPRVVAKLTDDLYHEDTERQRLAVTALGWIGELDVVEPLLEAIGHPDPGIRKSAINSLVRIGQVSNFQPIIVALNDENSAVRKAAVSALVALRGEEAVEDIRLLLEDADSWVRYHTISAFGELGEKRFAKHIIPYLQADLDIIKLAAAKALAQMGSREAIPVLNQLKNDRNEDLAGAAKMALNKIGSK